MFDANWRNEWHFVLWIDDLCLLENKDDYDLSIRNDVSGWKILMFMPKFPLPDEQTLRNKLQTYITLL